MYSESVRKRFEKVILIIQKVKKSVSLCVSQAPQNILFFYICVFIIKKIKVNVGLVECLFIYLLIRFCSPTLSLLSQITSYSKIEPAPVGSVHNWVFSQFVFNGFKVPFRFAAKMTGSFMFVNMALLTPCATGNHRSNLWRFLRHNEPVRAVSQY